MFNSVSKGRNHGSSFGLATIFVFVLGLFWFGSRTYVTDSFDLKSMVLTATSQKLHVISTQVSESPEETYSSDSSIDRPLVTYAYSESEANRKNLQFFVDHGLHDRADFLFILNGETDADSLIPTGRGPGIRTVRRNNTCYDLGSHAEVLTTDDLWRRYKRFILMNASVRGPFMPSWANSLCWTERLLSKVTDTVKLVGMSANCWPTPHVQSMIWATDSEGLGLLLHPPATSPRHDEWMELLFEHPYEFPRPDDYEPNDAAWVERGLSQCFANRQDAVEGEISATGIILAAGKKVDVLLDKYQTSRGHDLVEFCEPLGMWDPMGEGWYDGASVHPFETMFVKTNRGISPRLIDNLSEWADKMRYSSYEQCAYPR